MAVEVYITMEVRAQLIRVATAELEGKTARQESPVAAVIVREVFRFHQQVERGGVIFLAQEE